MVRYGAAMIDPVLRALMQCLEAQTPCVVATLVQVEGSAPRAAGARMLFMGDGQTVGTIGGGALEGAVLEASREALSSGQARLLSYDLRPDLEMICGGRARVFIEPHGTASRLYLFGAGHIGQALYPLAAGLEFEVVVVDQRAELACEQRFPGCRRFVHSYDAQQWDRLTFDQQTYCVVATAGHATDTEVVAQLLQHPIRYLGMIGSETKRRTVERKLGERGISSERVATIHTPVGLPIGAESPAEIAVSIAAELIQARSTPLEPRKENDQ